MTATVGPARRPRQWQPTELAVAALTRLRTNKERWQRLRSSVYTALTEMPRRPSRGRACADLAARAERARRSSSLAATSSAVGSGLFFFAVTSHPVSRSSRHLARQAIKPGVIGRKHRLRNQSSRPSAAVTGDAGCGTHVHRDGRHLLGVPRHRPTRVCWQHGSRLWGSTVLDNRLVCRRGTFLINAYAGINLHKAPQWSG